MMNYFPARFSAVFTSQANALKQFEGRKGIWTETPLENGAKFMALKGTDVAVVLVPHAKGGIELWDCGPDFGRLTLQEAQADIEEFESILGPGGWRVFKAVAYAQPTP